MLKLALSPVNHLLEAGFAGLQRTVSCGLPITWVPQAVPGDCVWKASPAGAELPWSPHPCLCMGPIPSTSSGGAYRAQSKISQALRLTGSALIPGGLPGDDGTPGSCPGALPLPPPDTSGFGWLEGVLTLRSPRYLYQPLLGAPSVEATVWLSVC